MADVPLGKYMTLVKELSDPVSTLVVGKFYCYMYLFKLDYPYEELKFYDHYPLVFIFDKKVTQDKNIVYYGLNFHFLPVQSRMIWYARITKMFKTQFNSGSRLTADYDVLYTMMKKSVFGVRQYRLDRVVKPRLIPNDNLQEIMKVANRTYFGVTLSQVTNKYIKFRP